MNETLQKICDSLESISNTIIESFSHETTLLETINWQNPPLTKYDFSNLFLDIKEQIESLNLETIDEKIEKRISIIPSRLEMLKRHSIPHLNSSNSRHVYPAILATYDWIRVLLSPLFTWEILNDKNVLPKNLTTKLKKIQNELETFIPNKEELIKSVELIQNAKEVIEQLPTEIEDLKESKKIVEKHKTDSSISFEKIEDLLKKSQAYNQDIINHYKTTEKLVENCEEAYRITSTKGLAGAFEKRADSLNGSLIVWVLALLIVLCAGAWLGSVRFETFSEIIKAKNTTTTMIVMEFILSILGLGAPIWFAWIATKQINQRFKLSEDYRYKASVAKAYEGYKKEANRLDINLENRLFSSALSRLEEAPLRLIDKESHGSPWQELLESEQFKNAINTFPDLREKLLDLKNEGLSKLSSNQNK